MGQNVTLLGANYTGVEDVALPKTGGGTATFNDTTISSGGASASNIEVGFKGFVNGTLIIGEATMATATVSGTTLTLTNGFPVEPGGGSGNYTDISSSFYVDGPSDFHAVTDGNFVILYGFCGGHFQGFIQIDDSDYEPITTTNYYASIIVLDPADGTELDRASYDYGWQFGPYESDVEYYAVYQTQI